jgi:tRNA (guanine-N7-)-methyltransferase
MEDPCIELVRNSSDEAKKVAKNKGNKYLAVYRRVCV